MSALQTRTITTRATSLLASAAMTALIVGSLLDIAEGYTERADGMLAAKNAQQPMAQCPAASSTPST